ncbi:hypothetical protein [Halarchaeum sp. P4]|uniref:hypothetical protein n=1 Tax=Halarchaeum sp. P4 TaxID=3421639 RepID=UPI003EBB896F
MRKRASQLVLLLVVVMVTIILWSVYKSYQSTGFTSSLASTLSTLALVLLTGWYAYSTKELLKINENQVEAARATYMPALDARYEYDDGEISLEVRNRGQGVARNVSILISIVGRGIDTYKLKLSESLPPQYSYHTPEGDTVVFRPKFYTEYTDKPLGELLQLEEGPDENFPEGDLGRSGITSEVSVDNLYDYMDNVGTSKALYSNFPADEGTLPDIIDRHTNGRPDTYSPAIYMQIVFTDVMYGQTHAETILDGVYTDPDEPSLDNFLPGEHTVKPRFRKAKNFRDVHGDIVESDIPYIEELDVSVRPNEPR